MKTVENNENTSRKKFVGFRVPVKQYITIVQSADSLGISITDYVLSKIFPVALVENNSVKQIELTANNQALNTDKPITLNEENKTIPKNNLTNTTKKEKFFSDENEKLLQTL